MALISKQTLREYAKGLVVIVLLLVVWEVAALIIQNNYILPTLGEIFAVLLHPAATGPWRREPHRKYHGEPEGGLKRFFLCSSTCHPLWSSHRMVNRSPGHISIP